MMKALLLPNVKVPQEASTVPKDLSPYGPSPSKTKSMRTFMRLKSPDFLKKEGVLSSAVKSLPPSDKQGHLLKALVTFENDVKGSSIMDEFFKNSSSRMTTATLGDRYAEKEKRYGTVREDLRVKSHKRDIAKCLIKIGKAMNLSYSDRIHNLTGVSSCIYVHLYLYILILYICVYYISVFLA
jgi:hypothetical protein